MRRYTKQSAYWTPEKQRSAAATKQRKRDALPDECRDDNRPTLTLRIGADDAAPLIHWRLTPIRGQIRRYRVTDADTGDIVECEGARVGGGRDAILRAAAKLMPKYMSVTSMAGLSNE